MAKCQYTCPSEGIGLLCLAVSRVSGTVSSPATAMVSWLGYINLALAGFNMIPGYPLDGGRILRALIWWKTGDVERSMRSRQDRRANSASGTPPRRASVSRPLHSSGYFAFEAL